MSSSENERPSWKTRGLALTFYTGAAPLFYFSSSRKRDAFLKHHYSQAAAIFLLLLIIVILLASVVAALTYAMIHQRAFYDDTHPEGRALQIIRWLFLSWAVFWAYAAGLALLGSTTEMPIVAFLTRRRFVTPTSVAVCFLIWLLVLAGLPLSIHALSITRQDEAPGKAYLLYEDLDRFPRWLFALGFYRLSRAANARWGPGSTVMLDLTESAIQRALHEGHFVFIGSHGLARGLLLESGYLEPADIQAMAPGKQLQFVYLTSCDSGAKKEAWEKALAPAQVITYARLTAVVEHIRWMWFQGPEVVRTLE